MFASSWQAVEEGVRLTLHDALAALSNVVRQLGLASRRGVSPLKHPQRIETSPQRPSDGPVTAL